MKKIKSKRYIMAFINTSVQQGFPYYGGGQVQNPANVIVAKFDPSNNATGNLPGTVWINTVTPAGWICTQNSGINGVVVWQKFGVNTGTVGFLEGDFGGVIGPTGGGVIFLEGTPNEIITTGGLGNEIGFGLSNSLIAPGSLEVTTNLVVDGSGISSIGTSNAATTINIANGTGGNTVSINNGANTSANITNINSTTSASSNTVNVLAGAYTGGTQTYNLMSGAGSGSTRAINIGTGASQAVLTIGNVTGNTGIAMSVGTGNFSLTGVTTSTIAIGTSLTTGTITIGGATQTGAITLGQGNSGSIVGIANGTGANAITIGNGANGSAQTVSISSGNSAANSTVNILAGAPSAGTQTFNLFSGTATGGTQVANICTGASANTLNLGNIISTSGIVMLVGSGNFSLNGVAGSTYAIGAATTSGTITIGGTAQSTGTITLGSSSATSTVAIAAGAGANTVSINNAASNANACIVNILSGATPGQAQTLNLMNGVISTNNAQALNVMTGTYTTGSQTVNLITGTPSGGTQAVNILSGTSTGGTQTITAGNIAQAANTVSILSGSAGGLTFTSGTASNTLFQAGGTYWGRQTNTAPAAGYIGEQLITTVTSGAAVTMTTSTTVYNIATINLTGGCWDVSGCIVINGTVQTLNQAGISTATNTLGTLGLSCGSTTATAGASAPVGVQTPVFRVNLSSTTSYYINAASTFGGSATGYGTIRAVRVS